MHHSFKINIPLNPKILKKSYGQLKPHNVGLLYILPLHIEVMVVGIPGSDIGWCQTEVDPKL